MKHADESRANGKAAYGWQRVHQLDDRGQVASFDDIEPSTPSNGRSSR